MEAREYALQALDAGRLGLEIGGSYSPMSALRPELKVRSLDHLDQAGLIEKYRLANVDISKIRPVDYVWSGERYKDLIGDTRFGWILASHVIEHVPNLIGFLNQCDEILEDDGSLCLLAPDKRFCFDFYRTPSGLAQVIDAHIAKSTLSSQGQVAEFALNMSRLDGKDLWFKSETGRPEFMHKPWVAQQLSAKVAGGEYVDSHNWVFTPHSLRLLVHDLNLLGLCPLREAAFVSSSLGEFYIQLSRTGTGPGMDRQTLCELALEDLEFRAADPNPMLMAENERLKAELEATRSSTSWRVTAPLRAARRLFG